MNSFSKLHPVVLLVYFIALLSIGMFVTNPVIEIISLAGAVLFTAMLTHGKGIKRDIIFYLLLMMVVTLTNPLFSHNGKTELFFLNGNPVTAEALAYGGYLAIMITSVMLWFKSYSVIMTDEKFVYLFGRALPRLSLVLSVSLRYVPMLKKRAQKISRTQKAMGLYSSENFADRVRSGLSVVSNLIGWSLENAVETGKAMKAAGYGLGGRTNYSDFRFLKSDFVFISVCVTLWAVVLAGMANGNLNFQYYPEISPLSSDVFSVLCYISYGLIAFLPFILEAGEVLRWKYYRSKI